MIHPTEGIAEDTLAGLERGERDAQGSAWADYAVYNVPGHNRYSGRHVGAEKINALLQRRHEALAGKLYQFVVTGTSASAGHVALFTQVHAACGGINYTWKAKWLYFLKDGQINGCWIFVDDLNAFDAFWNGPILSD